MVSVETLAHLFDRLSPEDQEAIADRFMYPDQFGTEIGQLPMSSLGTFIAVSVLGEEADALFEEIQGRLGEDSN